MTRGLAIFDGKALKESFSKPESQERQIDEAIDWVRGRLVSSEKHMQGIVNCFIQIGSTFRDLKSNVDHGRWEHAFSKNRKKHFTLSLRTAQRFISIADHPVISKTTSLSFLPARWSTLYELSRVPAKQLEAAITSGKVTTEMTQAQAKQLVPRKAKAKAPAKPITAARAVYTKLDRPTLIQELRRLMKQAEITLEDLK